MKADYRVRFELSFCGVSPTQTKTSKDLDCAQPPPPVRVRVRDNGGRQCEIKRDQEGAKARASEMGPAWMKVELI